MYIQTYIYVPLRTGHAFLYTYCHLLWILPKADHETSVEMEVQCWGDDLRVHGDSVVRGVPVVEGKTYYPILHVPSYMGETQGPNNLHVSPPL